MDNNHDDDEDDTRDFKMTPMLIICELNKFTLIVLVGVFINYTQKAAASAFHALLGASSICHLQSLQLFQCEKRFSMIIHGQDDTHGGNADSKRVWNAP